MSIRGIGQFRTTEPVQAFRVDLRAMTPSTAPITAFVSTPYVPPPGPETLEQVLVRRTGYTCDQLRPSCLPADLLPLYAGCFTGLPPAGVTQRTFDNWCLKMLACEVHSIPPCAGTDDAMAAAFPLPTCLDDTQVAVVSYCQASGWWGTNKLGNAACWLLSKAPAYWSLLSAVRPCSAAAAPPPPVPPPPPVDTYTAPPSPYVPPDVTAAPTTSYAAPDVSQLIPPGAGEETIEEPVLEPPDYPPAEDETGQRRLMTMGVIGLVGVAAVVGIFAMRRKRR